MTYLNAILYVGGVLWLIAFGLAVLGTFINTLNNDEEEARVTAKVVVAMLIITAATAVVAGVVWMEERQQFEVNSHD